ncbi:hypothetical protein ACJMK2_042193 [Sinanodonta woodiana]|uniref:Uncharacterized protein n=1 Tax=Sinanodonta woodiana TaxID=1069815 RepID=A0ABD3W6L6_SINWO
MTRMYFFALVLLMISSMLKTAYSCNLARSCKQIYKRSSSPVTGEYQLYTPNGTKFDVFCDFYDRHGYTFVSKEGLGVLTNLSQLFTNRSHVLVRINQTDGLQKDVKIAPHSQLKHKYPISFQLNQAVGYSVPLNATMKPYIHLGLLPESYERNQTALGYQAAGEDITFINCDSNPISYLAFLANPSNLLPNDYHKRCCKSNVVDAWIKKATNTTSSRLLPEKYLYYLEMHMGDCGGYVRRDSFPKVAWASVGLRFDL